MGRIVIDWPTLIVFSLMVSSAISIAEFLLKMHKEISEEKEEKIVIKVLSRSICY